MKISVLMMILLLSSGISCTKKKDKEKGEAAKTAASLKVYPTEKLPDGLKWESNDNEPLFASPDAKKGGTYHTMLSTFPLTLRTVGPDSNGGFRSALLKNQLGLTEIHPNTDKIIPELAEKWAYHSDGVTVFYKLNPAAKWSDGTPLVADDFLFGLEFMRSKEIVAPWYNTHYSEQILSVKKYDDHTISITGKTKKPKNDLHYYYGIPPKPRHFHELSKKWVKEYNWKIEPNTGPYQISKITKGKTITFERKKDWWAKDLRLFKNRFNVDKVQYKVIRDLNIGWEHFKKAKLESFGLTLPEYWHEKAKDQVFKKGYVKKHWFFVDKPQPNYGIWLNQAEEIFKDRNVRLAFGHAMNIDKVLKKVLRGDYFRLHNGTTGYGKYSNKDIKARPYSIKKVTELMKKSGWKRGSDGIWLKGKMRYAVRVTYGAPHHTNRLVVLKEEAKKAGIELELQLLDGSSAFKMTQEKKHQVSWSGWGAMYRPQYWGMYHSANAFKAQTNNTSNTSNKSMDKLIEQFKNELNVETRYKLAHQIQALIAKEGAYVPTFLVPYFRIGYWRWWQLPKVPATKSSDTFFNPFGAAGGLFWLDAKIKEETLAAMKSKKTFAPSTLVDKTYKTF